MKSNGGKVPKFLYSNALLLAVVFLFSISSSKAQVSGDYGAYTSGNWTAASTWKVYNGISWASSSVAAASPNSSSLNVFILAGVTVVHSVSQTPCNNLTINAGGKFYTNSAGSNVYIYVYGNIICDGTIGNGATFDAISFGIEGANCLFTGTGAVDCSRIRKNLSAIATTNLTINININLRFGTGSQTQIYNSADNATFNVIVNAGKTVNLTGNAGNIGNVAMDGIAGNDFAERGGSYLINGTLIITGTLYITTNNSSMPCSMTIGSTGIVQTTSLIANISGSATHTLTMISGGLLQITGTPFSNPFTLTNNIYNLNAGSTIEYAGAGVQTIDGNVTFANLKTSGSGAKTGAGVINANGDITITGTSVLTPNAVTPSINIGGNWSNYNTSGFAETGSTVSFIGSTNQSLACTSGENFNNLVINKSAGKVISSTAPATLVRVAGILNLTKGNIFTAATSYVLVQATGSVINVNDLSFVEGPCARQGTTVFNFPVGKIAQYRPIAISAPPSAGTLFIAEYFKIDPQSIPTTVSSKDPSIDHVSRCEYWTMRASVSTALVLTPSWNTYSCGVVTPADLLVTSWNGSLWKDLGNNGTSGTVAVGTVNALTASTITAATLPVTLATTTPINPLPVELISFTAEVVKKNVELLWSTATETNNDYFEIEKSVDGIEFEFVNRIKGIGTTSILHNYQTIDYLPHNGLSYYRLKQVDFDGTVTYSKIVPVNLIEDTKFLLYPNPADKFLSIRFNEKFAHENARIVISTISGQVIHEELFSNELNFEMSLENFIPGFYNCRVIHENGAIDNSSFIKN